MRRKSISPSVEEKKFCRQTKRVVNVVRELGLPISRGDSLDAVGAANYVLLVGTL